MTTDLPKLDRFRFDEMVMGEKLWGAKAIARHIGKSPDTVYRLAKKPDVPIYQPPGCAQLFAEAEELTAWMRTRA